MQDWSGISGFISLKLHHIFFSFSFLEGRGGGGNSFAVDYVGVGIIIGVGVASIAKGHMFYMGYYRHNINIYPGSTSGGL